MFPYSCVACTDTSPSIHHTPQECPWRPNCELSSSVHPVDQNLPLGKLSALGLQHVLVM